MATSNERNGTGRKSGSSTRSGGGELSGRRGTWMRDRLGDADEGAGRSRSRTARPGGASSGGASSPGSAGRDLDESGGTATATRPGTSGGGRPSGSGGTGRSGGPRKIRLTLARLDPFSVMKVSFVVAVAIGIATVVCVAVLWNLVNAMGIWGTLEQLGKDLNNGKPMPFMEFFKFGKMLSYTVLVAFLNLVIITALGTLFAFLYNIVAGMLGGLRMTFTDE